jgi:hypothetical protein
MVMLRAGEWVEVRSEAEILATLDGQGRLEGLPFMPQMVSYCGQRFRISKRAHKLCDTVNATGGRRLTSSVFLEELRCDGARYGGCEMECRFFWKEAWLKRSTEPAQTSPAVGESGATSGLYDLTARNARKADQPGSGGIAYSCQATEMPAATTLLSVWEPRQYIDDYRSGNATAFQIARVLFFLVYETVANAGLGIGGALRWCYDRVQALVGGYAYPARAGNLPLGAKTPACTLNLERGEIIKVKSHAEVLETVTEDWKNRGMGFHPEMVPDCGRTMRVDKRLRRILNEKTGQILELKNPCVVLENSTCKGHYTRPLLCPRGMQPYWREIWLERGESAQAPCSSELSASTGS